MSELQRNTPASRVAGWVTDNLVTVIFLAFTLIGFAVSNMSFSWFLGELTGRIYRNGFLVLSLIIPVIAGLGLNFGIVVGAMAGQIAIVFIRYYNIGGTGGILLAALLATPLAILFGWATGKLYNKTRGQEMIASLIVGYFANGLYQFLFLFAVGVIVKVPSDHPLIKPDGIGVRSTVDLGMAKDGGLKYSLDYIWRVDFLTGVIVIAAAILALQLFRLLRKNAREKAAGKGVAILNIVLSAAVIAVAVYSRIARNSLTTVAKVPVVTVLLIAGLCVFIELILRTKLGQDFKAVGQSQHISEVSGINVDRTRIIAVIISTVLAAWGQVIFIQNVGTLNTYNAHTQVGMFAVASILVGGASTSKATVKQALVGMVLFNAMFIMSPEVGQAVFGQPLLGEYFRTFMVYGVIGFALGLYVWKSNRRNKLTI